MRFILLLIAALLTVFAVVTAFQWSGKKIEISETVRPFNLPSLPTLNKAPPLERSSSSTAESSQSPTSAPAEPASTSSASSQSNGAQQQPVQTVEVLVARNDISMGSIINDFMIGKQTWPANLVPEHFIVADSEYAKHISGKIALNSFAANEPFITTKLADPSKRNSVASELGTGMRAITLSVDPVTAVGGYVYPGDRVDVVLVHNIPQELRSGDYKNTNPYRPVMSEVVAANLRVLAVNTRTNGDAWNSSDSAQPPSNVTVEVSDEYAQRIRLAEKVGSLSLSLRSNKENSDTIPAPTRLGQLSRGGEGTVRPAAAAPSAGPVAKRNDSVRIIRGPSYYSSQAPAAGIDCSKSPCANHTKQ